MYARVLRKWSLAKFLMNLWLVVIMLLVICCQNTTSMHLVRNIRTSRSSPHSLTTSHKEQSKNSDLGSTMTIYGPYDRLVDPYKYPFRLNDAVNYNPPSDITLNRRWDEAWQQRQLTNSGAEQRQYYSPYTIHIRTNTDSTDVNRNVPNIDSQIINLDTNNYANGLILSHEDAQSSPLGGDRNPDRHTYPVSEADVATLPNYSWRNSNRKRQEGKEGHAEFSLSARKIVRVRAHDHQATVRQVDPELPKILRVRAHDHQATVRQVDPELPKMLAPSASQFDPSGSAYDPFKPARNWLQVQNERRLRIERHRQRRHRHFEQIARKEPLTDDRTPFRDTNSNTNSNNPPSFTSTLSDSVYSSDTNDSKDSLSSKSSEPRLNVEDSNRSKSVAIVNPHSHPHNRSQRRRISRSHNGRRRPKRYCSARDPVQLAYWAPIVLEGRVRSMSTNRLANFSASFEVTQIFKNRQNHNIKKLELVRLQFTFLNTTGDHCDIYQEEFREPGWIRRDLLNTRNYTLFLKYVGDHRYLILGQPILSNQRVYNYVRNASQEKFGKPASVKSLTANRQNKVREKEELKIVCRVRGNPPPKITWFKDDKSIKQSRQLYQFTYLKRRSELIVKSFSNATAGLYECRAKNKVNKKVEKKTIRIEAYGRPESHNDIGEDCTSSFRDYCLNGGVCKFFKDIRQYYCKCAEGFEGERCQEKRPSNVSLNQTVTGYMADSPTDTISDESEESISLSEE